MSRPLEVRFWEKVEFSAQGCWEFATRSGTGYGTITLGGRGTPSLAAHRLSWELSHQETIPPKRVVMHTCDNPPCVNPSHLRLGTHSENQQDMARKGRGGKWRKLTDEQVHEVRTLRQQGVPSRDIADRYGISRWYVTDLCRRGRPRA